MHCRPSHDTRRLAVVYFLRPAFCLDPTAINLSRGCVQRSITRYQPQTLLLLDTYSVGCTVPVMYTHARLTDKPAHLTFLPEQSASLFASRAPALREGGLLELFNTKNGDGARITCSPVQLYNSN